ncbi:MAG: hypothetical protein Q9227_004303 [Pyrenula ochraceoflavens]
MAATAASQVHLSPKYPGLACVDANPPGSFEAADELLQKNHDQYHMYFRDAAGHNHIAHSILSVLAMGGGPKEIKRAYDDGEGIQRALPPLNLEEVKEMKNPGKFRARMLQLPQYTNFLCFFEQEIEAKGWQAVIHEYCFSHTPLAEAMLAQLFEGLFHPIIHLGFGIEFSQPSIVAEGLAHAASHDPMFIDTFFQRAEQLARSGTVPARPLASLYHAVRANDKLRTSSRLDYKAFRVRDGVLAYAFDEIVAIAAQFQCPADQVERGTAEMISCAAYSAGAAQKPGKQRKIDFFHMHNVTSSIFLTVLNQQPWISNEDKARLVEWKARLDLVWYAACAAAELRLQDVVDYEPTLSRGMDWRTMYKATNERRDDGHIAKFIRALKNGEEVAKAFEEGEGADSFPIKGDLWFKVAQMCFDTTIDEWDSEKNILPDAKWVWGAGFEPPWMRIPDLKEGVVTNGKV